MKKYFLENKWQIFMMSFCNFSYIVAIAGMPFITKSLFDYDFSQGVNGVIWIIVAYLVVAMTGMLAQYGTQVYGWRIERDCNISLRHDVFSTIVSCDYQEFSKESVSHYVSLLDNDVEVVVKQYFFNLLEMIQQMIQVLVYGVYLFLLDYRIAIVIMLMCCLTVKIPKTTGPELSRRKKAHQRGMGNYMKVVNDLFLGFKSINHQTREAIINRQDETLKETEALMYHFGTYRAFDIVLRGASMYMVNIVSYAMLGFLFLLKQITKGDGAAALQYITEFCYPVSYLLELYSDIRSARGVKDHLMQLIDEASSAQSEVYVNFKEGIEFKDVVVNYEDFQLGPINLRFEKGKKYALTGHSGSGKSTVLNLLMQYNSFEQGEILIDGIPLHQLSSTSMMMCLNQTEHLFLGSFLDNISVYQSYDVSELETMIRTSDCERLRQVSDKESCAGLSGGEKQVVNLVKSLMSQKSILLLDESFSALDARTKQKMYDLIYEQEDKLIIAVTHDLSDEHLKKFDEIILFDQGTILKNKDRIME